MRVRCPKCKEVFDWDPSQATSAVGAASSDDPPETKYPYTYSFTCPNNKCGASLKLELTDKEPEKIIDAELDIHPEINRFWLDYSKGIVNNTLSQLDDRAKNMITICASLIVVNFGLLLVFEVEPVLVNVTPQFFFAVSAAFFVVSYFPRKKEFHLDVPKSIEESYDFWMRWKLKWHHLGFAFFIVGLFAIAITGLL